MGYWGTTRGGASLQLHGDRNPDGSEMLWGDAPADRIDGGIIALIKRLQTEKGRFPTLAELDAARPEAPEMLAAIAEATDAFTKDVGRPPSTDEIDAGLRFSDSEIALDCAMRSYIGLDDIVRYAVWRDCGFYREIDYVAAGRVKSAETTVTGYHTKTVLTVERPDGYCDEIDKVYASRVLPGDKPIAEVNAERESRR